MKCQVCKIREATEKHHLFSQTKLNKILYPEFIHDERNLLPVCESCHKWKPMPKYSEKKFCEIMGISPRSKTERLKNQLDLLEIS